MYTLIFTIAAYLIGSISFAVVMSRAFGLSDPRTYGSKNPGATNVLRSGSKKAAIATLVGDCVKGWVPVAVAFAPCYYGLLFGVDDKLFAVVVMCALLLWRHGKNISNLLAGKESRIGSKAASAAPVQKKK